LQWAVHWQSPRIAALLQTLHDIVGDEMTLIFGET